jgi:hypothetical protein
MGAAVKRRFKGLVICSRVMISVEVTISYFAGALVYSSGLSNSNCVCTSQDKGGWLCFAGVSGLEWQRCHFGLKGHFLAVLPRMGSAQWRRFGETDY